MRATWVLAIGHFSSRDAGAIRQNASWAPSLADAVAGADLVVEAVSEDVAVKKVVLAEIEQSASPRTVLATNTSSIRIAELGRDLEHPQRLYGTHWFNTAQFLPCVEVIEGPNASPHTTRQLMELLRRAGREPVLVADSPGFVSNRLQFALFREAALMVEEGIVTPERLDEVVRGSFGFRLPFYGPFAIADMAGLDVYTAVFEVLEKTLGGRFSCPEGLSQLVAQGRLGTKSGAGYYNFNMREIAKTKADRDRAYVAMAQTLATWREPEPMPS